jgi:hypothetical protein
MKIFLSILLAISLSSIINAQDFAPVGAKWWYTQVDLFNPFFKSYSTIESIQDTIISNQSCRSSWQPIIMLSQKQHSKLIICILKTE